MRVVSLSFLFRTVVCGPVSLPLVGRVENLGHKGSGELHHRGSDPVNFSSPVLYSGEFRHWYVSDYPRVLVSCSISFNYLFVAYRVAPVVE